MNNFQMSLGNSKPPLCFTLGKVELSFSDKCKRCHAPKKFWIPPPGRTTKLCQCCWKKHPEPPIKFTVDVPADELLTSNTPFTIESSNIEKLKMMFLPAASIENNNSKNTPITPFDRVIESFNMQKNAIEGAEKVLEDNEKMRTTLSENVKSLKKNMNDIGLKINEINNQEKKQEKVLKEEIDTTQTNSTDSNQTKSVSTIDKRRENKLKKKSTKDSLRSEILRVENLLKNVQKLTESKLNTDRSFKVKTLETLNTFQTDQTESDDWVKEDFNKHNIKRMAGKSTTYELIQSLKLPTKNMKNKSIQTSFLRPVPMIKFQTTKKPHSIRQNRITKHRAIASHPKRAPREAVVTPKSSIEKVRNHATVENLMKKLADSMRKSKKLLDSIYRQDGVVESMQNKFIQEVEKLYQEQQSMLNDLYEVSKSSIDPPSSDISSSCESKAHYQPEQLNSSFPKCTEIVEYSPPNEWIDSEEIHSLSPEEVVEEMHTIEKTLAQAQGKLSELKKEYNEASKLLLNGSTTENKAVHKSVDRSKTDSGYSTINRTMPRKNPYGEKADNDIVYETVIKQTLRNVTIPELTKSRIHSPLAESIQNLGQAAIQLLPSYTNNLSGSKIGMTAIEGPLDSSEYLEESKKLVSEQRSPVIKPSGRFNYTGKPSSIESFGPLSEYPFNITDSDPEELGASSGSRRHMERSRRKSQTPHHLRTAPNEAVKLQDLKPHHKHLRNALSDHVIGNGFSPSSTSTLDRSRVPEYHDWAKTPPQDFSTPKSGRLKTSGHAIQVSDENTSIHNHPHHHKAHHGHHHGSPEHHMGGHAHHGHHNSPEHHMGGHAHHGHHNTPEHHTGGHAHHEHHSTPEQNAHHDLHRLRRRIDKLYEDIMSP